MNNTQQHSKYFIGKIAVILGASAMFAPVGTDMYLAGIVNVAKDFNVDVSKAQITLSIYFLGMAFGQVIYGPLIDRFGRRWPLWIGEAVFILSSLFTVYAGTIDSVIFLRLLQAIGGCSGMVIGRAVVRDLFDYKHSARIYAILGVVQGLGPILAPIMGNIIMSYWGWRATFICMAVFGTICLVGAVWGLPESLPKAHRRKTNMRQVIYDYKEMASFRSFMIPALSGAVAGSFLFAYICASPYVFMTVFGVSSTAYTAIFAINMVGTIVAAQVNHFLSRKWSPETMLKGALGWGALTSGILVLISGWAPMVVFMIPLWLTIATMPVIFANSVAIAMKECGEKAGIASALLGLLQFACASLAGLVVSVWHNGTPAPMSWIMLAAFLMGLTVYLLGLKREPGDDDDEFTFPDEEEPQVVLEYCDTGCP